MPKRDPDLAVRQLMLQLETELKAEAERIGGEDVADLAELALWARLETTVTDRHRDRAREIHDAGRTWADIASAVGLAGPSSAMERYSAKAEARRKRRPGDADTKPKKRSVLDGTPAWAAGEETKRF